MSSLCYGTSVSTYTTLHIQFDSHHGFLSLYHQKFLENSREREIVITETYVEYYVPPASFDWIRFPLQLNEWKAITTRKIQLQVFLRYNVFHIQG